MKRELFGGAITIDLPNEVIDVSDMRQVPDTQEVFVESRSMVSYIVEILVRVDKDDPSDAVKFHFESIAEDNEAQSSTVIKIIRPPSPETSDLAPILLSGEQIASKFNKKDEKDRVAVRVALYRLAKQRVDIVLTRNEPLSATQPADEKGDEEFAKLAKSLEIVDYNLFSGGSS